MRYGRHYAKDYFPWADIEPGYTLTGFMERRMESQRAAWARVLAGTDEQLAAALADKFSEHHCASHAANEAFARYRITYIAEDFAKFPLNEWRIFAAGYEAGLNGAKT